VRRGRRAHRGDRLGVVRARQQEADVQRKQGAGDNGQERVRHSEEHAEEWTKELARKPTGEVGGDKRPEPGDLAWQTTPPAAQDFE
jgi:hypothetical protein